MRLIYISQFSRCLFFSSPTGDPGDYYLRAREILAGDWLGTLIPFHSSPPYPYFMAAAFSVSGGSFFFLYLLQALLGAGNCVLVYLLARRISGPSITPALVAGSLAAFDGLFAFFDASPLMICVTIFCTDLALVLLVKAHDSGRIRPGFFAGLAFGVAALDKTNLLIFVPVALFFLSSGLSLSPERWRWRPGAAFLAALALVIFPVTLRNYVVGHDFVLVTSNAGVNL